MAKQKAKLFPRLIVVAWEEGGKDERFLVAAPHDAAGDLAYQDGDRIVAIYERKEVRSLHNRTEVV